MREAWRFKKEFHDWTRKDRDDKIRNLYSVIQEYVLKGAAVTIPISNYEYYSRLVIHKRARDPYFFAAYYMMVEVAQNRKNGD